jgi:hypothetical protein
LHYYQTALDLLSEHQQTLRVKRSVTSLNNNLGVIHYMIGDFEEALLFFIDAV